MPKNRTPYAGPFFEVYREMGSGFLEPVYQECLEKEFNRRKPPYVPQVELKPTYKGELLVQTYKADFVCFGKIVVELKAVRVRSPKAVILIQP
jgi:GxxExxY protein